MPRPRLERALDDAATRPVTVLIAPAGSGKTASLAGWSANRDDDALWLAVRSTEQGARLPEALLAAAGAQAATSAVSPVPPDAVVDALHQSVQDPVVLVVDDAHHLSPSSWDLLDTVLTLAPDRVRLVLSSRRDAPLPLVALELAHDIAVLRADAFRFDDDEAATLVAAHNRDVPDDDLRALLQRAGGWAAALVLGARRLGGGAAGDRAAARQALSRTDQPVLDYLLGDVFSTLSPATRHVLLCTAGEPEVDGEAATTLSGDPDAADRLADLAAEGMLVTSYVQGTSTVWQYHPLLQELLRRQVAPGRLEHQLVLVAHARAAHHYAAHGPAPLALRHAMAAGDQALVALLLVERGVTLLVSGHEELLSGAVALVADDAAEPSAALHGVTALLLRCRGLLEEAMREATLASRAARTSRAELAAAARPPSQGELALLADSATLNAWLARFGWHDLDDAIGVARDVLGEQTGAEPGPRDAAPQPLEPARTAWLLHELSMAETWADRLDDAARHADEALLITQTFDLPWLSAAALADRSILALLRGQLTTAAESARDCWALGTAAERYQDGPLNRAHVAIGWAAFYDLRLTDAASALSRLRTGDRTDPDPLEAVLALVLTARLEAERGDVTAARRMLANLPPRVEPQPAYLRGILAVVQAQWAMVTRDLAEVQRQVGQLDELGWEVSAGAFRAVVSDLGGDADAARRQLETLLLVPAEGEQVVCEVFAAAYLARLHLGAGRRRAARASMREALTRAAPQRLLHPLVTGAAGGPDLTALLVDLSTAPDAHPFASAALEAAARYRRRHADLSGTNATPPAAQPQIAAQRPHDGTDRHRVARPVGGAEPARMPPESLTGREAEVLRELALGSSYADIAHALYVTENTVKTHVSSLYRKLGAERRAEALRIARQLGLL